MAIRKPTPAKLRSGYSRISAKAKLLRLTRARLRAGQKFHWAAKITSPFVEIRTAGYSRQQRAKKLPLNSTCGAAGGRPARVERSLTASLIPLNEETSVLSPLPVVAQGRNAGVAGVGAA